MKILISAYSCETGRGSEGEIGWRMVNALAQKHEVRVITRANLRAIHEAGLEEDPAEGSRFGRPELCAGEVGIHLRVLHGRCSRSTDRLRDPTAVVHGDGIESPRRADTVARSPASGAAA